MTDEEQKQVPKQVPMVPIGILPSMVTTEITETTDGPVIQQTVSTPAGATFVFHAPEVGLQIAGHLIQAVMECAPAEHEQIAGSIRDLLGVLQEEARGGLATPTPAEIVLPPGVAPMNGHRR
jgi:hypothetical protein